MLLLGSDRGAAAYVQWAKVYERLSRRFLLLAVLNPRLPELFLAAVLFNGKGDWYMRFLGKYLVAFFILCAAHPAWAACTLKSDDTPRKEGVIVYNKDFDVLQVCIGTKWRALGRIKKLEDVPCGENLMPGCIAANGTVYAGRSPDGERPMYTTRCDAGLAWNGIGCTGVITRMPWNNGNGAGNVIPGTGNPNTGKYNTDLLASLDADTSMAGDQPYIAAQYCANLNAYGHDDWYLPALNESLVMLANQDDIRHFENRAYWTSLQTASRADTATIIIFPSGVYGHQTRANLYNVRCVRKD